MEDGFPTIRSMEAEAKRMNRLEDLQYAVVDKFSYGWPKLELRRNIPTQCGIKGDVRIVLLRHKYVLIRCELVEDYQYYVKECILH